MPNKKLLIVDDELRYRERFERLAKEAVPDLEIILAEGVGSGLEAAIRQRPDAIVTDKDMGDGTGNDLAKAVKFVYQPPIAGITGGNPDDFDPQYVDIRESKTIQDERYKEIVIEILGIEEGQAEGVEKRFFGKFKEVGPKVHITKDRKLLEIANGLILDYAPIDILIQGYELAKALERGEQPVEGIQLPVPDGKKVQAIFQLENIALDAAQLFAETRKKTEEALKYVQKNLPYGDQHGLVRAIGEFQKNNDIRNFMGKLENCTPKRINLDECTAFHQAYCELVNQYERVAR